MDTPRIRLLLVEDNPGDARLLREFLLESGRDTFELIPAESLAEAVGAIVECPPDAILLDLSLPDAHGLETVAGVQEAAPSVPIIVLTGLDDRELALEAVQAGAQDYLVKGQVRGALLERAVRYAMERKHLEREWVRALALEKQAKEEAEAATERATRATRQRDEVLAMVTHDLRSPLNGVILGTSAILRRGALEEETRKRVAAIQRAADRMNRLLQDLLDVASIEAGRLSVDIRAIDVEDLVREATELLGPSLREAGLELELELPDDLPPVYADRVRLNQVLSNLLSNAIQFTPQGGDLRLRAAVQGSSVQFSVIDTGSGIPEAEREHLFDRFWRPPSPGRGGGTGLGLAISRGIVEALGGSIWVESEVGQGSAFHFTVPVAKGEPASS